MTTTEAHCGDSNISTHEDHPWFFQHSLFPVSGDPGIIEVDAIEARSGTDQRRCTWVTHAATDMGVRRSTSTPNRSVSDGWPLLRLLVSPQISLALSERAPCAPGITSAYRWPRSLFHPINCDWWAGRHKLRLFAFR